MELIEIILIAVSGVMFTFLVDDFIKEGMIFSFWGFILERNPDKWYLKPLWLCLTCTLVWMILFMVVLYYYLNQVWAILFCLSIGNWLLNVFIAKNLN